MKPVDSLTDDELSRRLIRAVKALPDAPLALQRAAIGLFPAAAQPASLKDVAASAFKLVQAVLSFDSWATPALAGGMRSATASTRHLLFTAQGCDIDLRISASIEAFVLAGQVLGPDEQALVKLAPQGGGGDALQVAVDELGEFRIDGVRRGTYLLTLELGSEHIVLPPIEVDDCRT
jgi:hypothetical protein